MSRFLRSIDWRRHGLTVLRLALHGTGWAFIHAGRLLESGGDALSAIGNAIQPKPKTERRG